MSLQGEQLLLSPRVPDLESSIGTTAHDAAVIWTPGHAVDGIGVPFEGVEFLPGPRIPNLQVGITAVADDARAVRIVSETRSIRPKIAQTAGERLPSTRFGPPPIALSASGRFDHVPLRCAGTTVAGVPADHRRFRRPRIASPARTSARQAGRRNDTHYCRRKAGRTSHVCGRCAASVVKKYDERLTASIMPRRKPPCSQRSYRRLF
jgi:hypothetical protein